MPAWRNNILARGGVKVFFPSHDCPHCGGTRVMKARREGVILNNIGNGGENFDFNTVDGGITSKRSIT